MRLRRSDFRGGDCWVATESIRLSTSIRFHSRTRIYSFYYVLLFWIFRLVVLTNFNSAFPIIAGWWSMTNFKCNLVANFIRVQSKDSLFWVEKDSPSTLFFPSTKVHSGRLLVLWILPFHVSSHFFIISGPDLQCLILRPIWRRISEGKADKKH